METEQSITRSAKIGLDANESAFRTILESSPIGVAVMVHVERDGDVFATRVLVNDALVKMFGAASAEALNAAPVAASWVDQDELQHANRIMRERKSLVDFEVQRRRVDGSRWWVSLNSRPIELNNSSYTVVWHHDVTARKLAEDGLRHSEEQFRDYAETAADLFWELDSELRYRRFEGHSEELLGVPVTAVLGQRMEEFWHSREGNELRSGALTRLLEQHRYLKNIEVYWNHANGERRTINISGKPLFNAAGQFTGYRGICRDVSEFHRLTQQLFYQARHDPLTSLINRREFEERAAQLLHTAHTSGAQHVLCYLDLDQFKVVNDTCGHVAGDELLRQLSVFFLTLVRKSDTLARLGGDEFGLLIPRCSLHLAEHVAETIVNACNDFVFQWQERTFKVGVSIGLAPITSNSTDVASVLSMADTACYAAKERGSNQVRSYHTDDAELVEHRSQAHWVARIQWALDNDKLRLYCQEIAPARAESAHRHHYELLLRMEDESGQLVMPGTFLKAAERFNIAPKLDRWVVAKAFECLNRNPQHLEKLEFCSINLSGQSIGDEQMFELLNQLAHQNPHLFSHLCFEITETATVHNLSQAVQFMQSLGALGCRFALDDFGSGLSSFTYLKHLPVNFLKIDGAFVSGIVDDPLDLALVKSITEIGHVLGKQVIAEFVESEAIREQLCILEVDYLQGYAIGRPQPFANILN